MPFVLAQRRIRSAAGHIDAERAIREIRAGRPAILRDGAARGSARLALAGPRSRRIGLDRAEPGFVASPRIDVARAMTNNPAKIAPLTEGGMEVVSDQRVPGRENDRNARYFVSRWDRAGHLLERDVSPLAHRGAD